MSKQYKPSTPFPNGFTYVGFNNCFCCDCKKYKLDKHGYPLPDNCTVENALSLAQIDRDSWPSDSIVEIGNFHHVCLLFESEDPAVMASYRKLLDGL